MSATTERVRAYQRRKKAEGLCIRCGQEPAVTAEYCEGCRQKRNRQVREARRPNARVIHCGLCGGPRHNRRACQELWGARVDAAS